MTQAFRGVNLGGWLVAERWMTPQLFEGVDGASEYALGRSLGREETRRRLAEHRATFITEADFAEIYRAGYDFVRLPVGYWLFDPAASEFVDGEAYVDQAFSWAARYGLRIVLDFHGLQGSQNGYDHSGREGKIDFFKRGNDHQALKTLEYMSQKYGRESSLMAIEVINEPKVGWFRSRQLVRYYSRAQQVVHAQLGSGVATIVSDGFRPEKLIRLLKRRHLNDRVVLDVHLYQIFTPWDRQATLDEHVARVEEVWQPLLERLSRDVPVMVGEWSAALPGRAYEGLSGGEAEHAGVYFRAQQQLFDELAWAHSYWSYRAPGLGVWSLRDTSWWPEKSLPKHAKSAK